MKRKPIVCWGASGHAKAVANVIGLEGEYEIVGFIDDVNLERRGEAFEGRSILGGDEVIDTLEKQGIHEIALAFGHCAKRIEIGRKLQKKGFNLPAIVHCNAIVAPDVILGAGVVVLGGAVIDAGCDLGDFAIVNNGAIISHECLIGEGTHISPGVNIAGRVTVGNGCVLGIGAIVVDKIVIGDFAFIGAGAVVTKDVPSNQLVYGTPARVIRQIETPF